MSTTFLRQNQTPSERIKQQKREWYYRNRKSVLKQQQKSEERKESKKEWYEKNREVCIAKSLDWNIQNPIQRKSTVQKYTHRNSARTKFWKPYNIPDHMQLEWIENFGRLQKFDQLKGKLSKRLTLEIAPLKESNLVIIHHHYLHRSRTMSQLSYWICIDEIPVGVLLYSLPETRTGRRRNRRGRRTASGQGTPSGRPPVWPGLVGGRYRPLSQRDMERIHSTVMDILEKVGLSDPTPSLIEIVGAAGGWISADGRLCYPRGLVEDVIARAKRSFFWPGQSPAHDLEVGGQRVHMGTGGAAPLILDFNTGRYRETTLVDVYDITRLADTLENIHFVWRTVVARDMPNAFDLDLNTAYACMQGTSKHIGVSFVNGEHVRAAVDMFDIHLGGEGRFRKRPFCSISCCHVVSPLRFAQRSCDALESAVMSGMPASLISAAQAGATGPATLAGTIALAMAETLAGLVFAS